MTRAAKLVEPILLTDWYGGDTAPAHHGWYDRLFTDGIHSMWWNGVAWFHVVGGPPHWRQVGSYVKWRGQRFWVLVRLADPLLSAIAGAPVDVYLESARPRSAKFGGLVKARPFKTEVAAQRFAGRFAQLGLTAVLP